MIAAGDMDGDGVDDLGHQPGGQAANLPREAGRPMKVKLSPLGALLAALLALGPRPALAGPVEEAKALFYAGAQAYDAGQFPAPPSRRSRLRPYRLAARPGILFSIAQAHRKQYYIAKHPDDLRAALKGYREYLAQVQQGGRRS